MFNSVQSHPTLCNPLDWSLPGFPVHHQLPPGLAKSHVHWVIWCHLAISSSVFPFSSCLQYFPASGFSPESALRIRWPKYWSFSFSISPSNEYSGLIIFRIGWFDLLQSKGFSRVFSNTTVQKHQFFGTQLSLWSKSHIHTWQLENPQIWLYWSLPAS